MSRYYLDPQTMQVRTDDGKTYDLDVLAGSTFVDEDDVNLLDEELEVLKDSVVDALQGMQDFEGRAPSHLNYLQCIRRLVERHNLMIDLLADRDPRMGKLDAMRMVDGFEEEITMPDACESYRNQTLARRVHDLENENALQARQIRRLTRDIECEECYMAKMQAPDGAERVECYLNEGREYVIIGQPDHDDEDHNCDALGCSSVSHVVKRVPK